MTQPDIQRLAGILRMHMGHTFINNAYHPAEMVGIITSYPVNDGRRAAVFNLLERPGSLSVEEIRDLNETPLRGADGKPGLPLIDHATENGRITDPVIVERRVREAMAQNAQIRARIDAIKFGKTTKGS